ncbi:MAG: hypothetical protein ACUVWY_14575 [Desulfosoma sp.]|uniref:hypothetical protein n=1 Tax=Desulfosoma sp. TaxID=2603217 RepID=UPI00404979B7
MKCTKCGFVGFDHVRTCAKCGRDLEAVRQELNLWDFSPAVPSFLVDAMLAMCQKAGAAAAAAEAPSPELADPFDLLSEIDLKVDLDEKPEEITLELLDEREEVLLAPQPMGKPSEAASEEQGLGEEDSVVEEQPLSLDQGLQDLDLKIAGADEGEEEVDVFDLSDVEDTSEFAVSVDEERLSEEALEHLRRELASADDLLKDLEGEAPDAADVEREQPFTPRAEESAVDVLSVEGDAPDEDDLKSFPEPGPEGEEEDVFILMEERDGGLAVQEFILEEGASKEDKAAQASNEELVLDLDALTEELKPEEGPQKTPMNEDPALDGLVLELEDGFYIEPDEDEKEGS